MNKEQVIRLAEKHLQDRHPGGATLAVVGAGVRHEQDWWYVPVRPDVEPAKRYEYYETLANVERELQQAEHITVLFLPTVPEESFSPV